MNYRLYTDGSSHARAGLPGGWAWLLVEPATEVVHAANCGSEADTSNNRMELTAAIEGLAFALQKLQRGDGVKLCSDSQYVLGIAFDGYFPSKNFDLVERMQNIVKAMLMQGIDLTGEWIKGHSGEEWNEAVDNMATKAKHELVEVLDRAAALRDPITIIAGSRHITDFDTVSFAICSAPWNPKEVVCGMADGVDKLGKEWAEILKIPVKEFPADWSIGKRAGAARNRQMATYANSLILIWDGKSPGSADMLKQAKKFGLVIHEVIL